MPAVERSRRAAGERPVEVVPGEQVQLGADLEGPRRNRLGPAGAHVRRRAVGEAAGETSRPVSRLADLEPAEMPAEQHHASRSPVSTSSCAGLAKVVCSYFEWDYGKAEVAAATSMHRYRTPFVGGMADWVAMGPQPSAPGGTVAVRKLRWRLSLDLKACSF